MASSQFIHLFDNRLHFFEQLLSLFRVLADAQIMCQRFELLGQVLKPLAFGHRRFIYTENIVSSHTQVTVVPKRQQPGSGRLRFCVCGAGVRDTAVRPNTLNPVVGKASHLTFVGVARLQPLVMFMQ